MFWVLLRQVLILSLQGLATSTPAYAPPRTASASPARRYLHRADPKHPALGASWYVLPSAALPEPVQVAPSAGRRR